jgi:hypothetical protein
MIDKYCNDQFIFAIKYEARLAQSVERETFINLKKEEISRPRVRAPYRARFFLI